MAAKEHLSDDLDELRARLRRAALLTSGAGIGFGVLASLAWLLLRVDSRSRTDSGDPFGYIQDEGLGAATLAGMYLLPFAAILFLWFIVALRGWTRASQRRRNMLISDLQLVSGVAFVGVFLVGGGALATSLVVAGSEDGELVSESLRTLSAFGNTLMVVMGVRMAGIFVLATSTLGMTTGVLPRWFNLLGYVFGVLLMLAPVVEDALSLAFPIWVIALSVALLYHLVNVPSDALPGFAARYMEEGGDVPPAIRD